MHSRVMSESQVSPALPDSEVWDFGRLAAPRYGGLTDDPSRQLRRHLNNVSGFWRYILGILSCDDEYSQ